MFREMGLVLTGRVFFDTIALRSCATFFVLKGVVLGVYLPPKADQPRAGSW